MGGVRIGHQDRSPGYPNRELRIGHQYSGIGHRISRIGHQDSRIGHQNRTPRICRQTDQDMFEYTNYTKPTRIGHQADQGMFEYTNYTKPTRIGHQADQETLTIISPFRDAFFVWPCWTARCSEWKMSIGSCCFFC